VKKAAPNLRPQSLTLTILQVIFCKLGDEFDGALPCSIRQQRYERRLHSAASFPKEMNGV
jgi:hypothetical protein